MAVLNKPENRKTNEAHDLGQISIETYIYKGEYWARLKHEHPWETSVAYLDGDTPTLRASFIHWGFCIKERHENQFLLCLHIAEATSKKKADRDYAKKKIAQYEEKGRAFYEAAKVAIAAFKAQQGESK